MMHERGTSRRRWMASQGSGRGLAARRRRPLTRARRLGPARRGSVYILVLGMSMIVSVVGFSVLTLARLDSRALAMETQAQEAQVLAQDGVEYAINHFTLVKWWLDYTSGVESSPVALGGGSFTFKLVDELDGNLANNTFEPVRLYVYGRVGRATRCLSVLLQGTTPLDVLRRTVHSAAGLTVPSSVLTSVGAAVSTGGTLTNNGSIVGAAECLLSAGSGTVSGGVTILALGLQSPSASVFDMYRSWSTTIRWADLDSGQLIAPLLSSTVNPTGGATNARGIYSISVPANNILSLQVSRIKGTLVVDCASGSFVRLDQSAVNWEPHSSCYPILIIRHATTAAANDLLCPPNQTIAESSVGANLNPEGTPYQQVADRDTDDTYPSTLSGLIHVITPALSAGKVMVQGGSVFYGTLLADCTVQVTGGRFVWNGALYDSPPIGYSVGPELQVVPGSWRREVIP